MKASLIGVTALSMLPGVLGLGNIVFFYSNNCSGTAVGCWNIGVGTCCTGGGTAFASGKAENGESVVCVKLTVTVHPSLTLLVWLLHHSIYLDAWSHTGCTGTRIGGQTAGNCLQPSFASKSPMPFILHHDSLTIINSHVRNDIYRGPRQRPQA